MDTPSAPRPPPLHITHPSPPPPLQEFAANHVRRFSFWFRNAWPACRLCQRGAVDWRHDSCAGRKLYALLAANQETRMERGRMLSSRRPWSWPPGIQAERAAVRCGDALPVYSKSSWADTGKRT